MSRAIERTLAERFTPVILIATLMVSLAIGAGVVRLDVETVVAGIIASTAAVFVLVVMVRSGVYGLGLSFFLLGTFLVAMNGVRLTGSIALSDVFLIFGAILVLVRRLSGAGLALPEYRRFIQGTLLLLLGALIASLLSADPIESILRLAKLSVSVIVIPWAILLWRPSPRLIRYVVWSFTLSATTSAIVGLVLGPNESSTRATGLAGHPNALGLTCVLALGPALMFALRENGLQRLAGATCGLALLSGVLISGSRAAILGSVMVVLAALILTRSFAVFVKVGLIGLPIGFLLLSGSLGNSSVAFDRLFESSDTVAGVSRSNAERENRLRDALISIEERPFVGVGLAEARAAHNVYLQLFSSAGIIGLVGFLIVVTAVLRPAFSLARNRLTAPSPSLAALQVGISIGYLGFLTADFFQNALWERYMWIPPALAVALGTQLAPSRSKAEARLSGPETNGEQDRQLPVLARPPLPEVSQ